MGQKYKERNGEMQAFLDFPDRRNDIPDDLCDYFFFFDTSLFYPAPEDEGKAGLKTDKIIEHFGLRAESGSDA